MNILVTGARGFVGKNLVAALRNIRDGKDRTHPELDIREIFKYLSKRMGGSFLMGNGTAGTTAPAVPKSQGQITSPRRPSGPCRP